jgi:hypothetical protein
MARNQSKKVRGKKAGTRRRQRGAGWLDSLTGKSTTVAATADAASTSTAPDAEASVKPEPQMNMNQRMSGFTSLANAAYVLNRMEDKLDFLLQKSGLDEERKGADSYWKRSQFGYFAKKTK